MIFYDFEIKKFLCRFLIMLLLVNFLIKKYLLDNQYKN